MSPFVVSSKYPSVFATTYLAAQGYARETSSVSRTKGEQIRIIESVPRIATTTIEASNNRQADISNQGSGATFAASRERCSCRPRLGFWIVKFCVSTRNPLHGHWPPKPDRLQAESTSVRIPRAEAQR